MNHRQLPPASHQLGIQGNDKQGKLPYCLDQLSKRFRTFSKGPSLEGTHSEGVLTRGGASGAAAAGPLAPQQPHAPPRTTGRTWC